MRENAIEQYEKCFDQKSTSVAYLSYSVPSPRPDNSFHENNVSTRVSSYHQKAVLELTTQKDSQHSTAMVGILACFYSSYF